MTNSNCRSALDRIEAFNVKAGGGVGAQRRSGGYTLFLESTGEAFARLKPTGKEDQFEVLWWSRERWRSIGDFGGMSFPLEEALQYIAKDPMRVFRR